VIREPRIQNWVTPGSPGTTVSRPDSRKFPGSRSYPEPSTTGSRSHPDLQVPGAIRSPGSPSHSISDFTESLRVPGVVRNEGFRVIPGNRSFGNSMSPGYTGSRSSG